VPTHLQDLEDELANQNNPVVLIAGAGVAVATDPSNPCAGWTGLLRHGLAWCRERCQFIRPSLISTYAELLEAGELLPVASFVSETLRAQHEGEYAKWLAHSVGTLNAAGDSVIRALATLGAQIATTNYDNLIEVVTGRNACTWKDASLAFEFLRGRRDTVLHLHGHYQRPDTVVFDARGYEDVCREPQTQAILRAFLTTRTVVFVGCGAGLHDRNFHGLFEWGRGALANSPFAHYRLVTTSELQAVSDECAGLPIRPIAYGPDHASLGPFLHSLAARVDGRRGTANPLDALIDQQDNYAAERSRLDELRSELAAAEYVAQRLQSARQLWLVGGQLTAALDMNSIFEREGDKLSPEDRVRIGLEIADLLLEAQLDRFALSILQRLAIDIERSDFRGDVRQQFNTIQARCMNNLCAYGETVTAINRAIEFATGHDRSRLEAQRAEIQLLQGELQEAIDGLAADGMH
jgi:SIR2-like domain